MDSIPALLLAFCLLAAPCCSLLPRLPALAPLPAAPRSPALFRRPPPSPLRSENLPGEPSTPGSSNSNVNEFASFDQLQEIVKLSSNPLPERPDGVIVVAKYTTTSREDCVATEAGYERMARAHPDTVFLRCFEQYEGAGLLLAEAGVVGLPTTDVWFKGNRVGRVVGCKDGEVEGWLARLVLRRGCVREKGAS